MSHFKRLILWLALVAGIVCLIGDASQPGEPAPGGAQSIQRLSSPQVVESEIMNLNLRYGARLSWRAALKRAMLIKANWLANRLNLPIKRPIYTTDIKDWQAPRPDFAILRQSMPSAYPDTVFGTDIYNTNFSRLQRILSFKIGLNGNIVTPPFSFSYADGQVWDIARLDASESDRYVDRYAARFGETTPSSAEAAQAYQLATNWLAAVDVNLDMLEKSRLPHSVHQDKFQPPDGSPPQPVYFVDWGTNYYKWYWMYHYWHTNEWHPAVSVKIGPDKELLEMYVGDATYFRNPPMLIPSKTVWRLVHTPNPPLSYLQTPAGMREFIMTPEEVSQYGRDLTNGVPIRLWLYQHHQLGPLDSLYMSNDLQRLNSELIPYTPGS
jgi:hypothetical protein